MPRTLFDKVWDAHLVRPETADTPAVLYVDLHLVHEVTSPQAFAMLRERGRKVRRPELTVATMDHSTPTTPRGADGRIPVTDREAAAQIDQLETNCRDFGIRLHTLGSERQGIVHVIGPEMGLTQPGMTIVCGDSHTSTHGAFGALAFGIGTTEVAHVLMTQCLLQARPRMLAVTVGGRLHPGMAVPVRGAVPSSDGQASMQRALGYMGLRPGQRLLGHPIDVVFIGSCTNARLSDLRLAASLLRGRKVAANVRLLVVPGSQQVKKEAEAEGLDRVFRDAGGGWGEAGCSMGIAMDGGQLPPRQAARSP